MAAIAAIYELIDERADREATIAGQAALRFAEWIDRQVADLNNRGLRYDLRDSIQQVVFLAKMKKIEGHLNLRMVADFDDLECLVE